MVYYGISLSTSGLGVNAYISAFVSGAVEIPAYLSCWFILDRYGRRLPISGYLIVAGVACIVAVCIRKIITFINIQVILSNPVLTDTWFGTITGSMNP